MKGKLQDGEDETEMRISPIREAFEHLEDSLDAKNVLGEPIYGNGRARIPVRSVSARAIALPSEIEVIIRKLGMAEWGSGVRRQEKELGYIIVDSSGVRWHPKMNTMKLAGAAFMLLASTVVLARGRGKSPVAE